MGILTGAKLAVGAALLAALAFLYWQNGDLKADNDALRLDLAAAQAAQRFAEEARRVAIAEADRQAVRDAATKARTATIRRRPDGNEAAPAIILDAIGGLRDRQGGVSPGSD